MNPAEALVTHITKRLGDIVYAANRSEALQQLAQCPLDAAVLARQADTDALAAALGAKGIPFCVLDKGSAAPVTVSAGEVVVSDADLVVPTLRDLGHQYWPPQSNFWRLSPSADKWQTLPPMIEPRWGHRMVAHQGRLYVIGGRGRTAAC